MSYVSTFNSPFLTLQVASSIGRDVSVKMEMYLNQEIPIIPELCVFCFLILSWVKRFVGEMRPVLLRISLIWSWPCKTGNRRRNAFCFLVYCVFLDLDFRFCLLRIS